MIDEIMTPIAAMLTGNKFIALLSCRVFFCHFSIYLMIYRGNVETDVIGVDSFISG